MPQRGSLSWRRGRWGVGSPRRVPTAPMSCISLVAAMCLLVLVGGWFNLWTPPSLKEAGWFQWGIAHLKAALLLSGVVGLVGLLAWALPTMAISLATGREAFMLPAATLVEAEPLPNARASDGRGPAENGARNPRKAVPRHHPRWEPGALAAPARPAGLNHSLYDAPEVRDRVALWLREQAGAPAAGLCRTR